MTRTSITVEGDAVVWQVLDGIEPDAVKIGDDVMSVLLGLLFDLDVYQEWYGTENRIPRIVELDSVPRTLGKVRLTIERI